MIHSCADEECGRQRSSDGRWNESFLPYFFSLRHPLAPKARCEDSHAVVRRLCVHKVFLLLLTTITPVFHLQVAPASSRKIFSRASHVATSSAALCFPAQSPAELSTNASARALVSFVLLFSPALCYVHEQPTRKCESPSSDLPNSGRAFRSVNLQPLNVEVAWKILFLIETLKTVGVWCLKQTEK